MLTINTRRVARLKGIPRPLNFLVSNGFTYHTARNLLAGKLRRVDLGDLERLCRIFQCEPYDLLDYTPSRNQPKGLPDHLAFLTKQEVTTDIHRIIGSLTLDQMAELTQEVAARYKKAG